MSSDERHLLRAAAPPGARDLSTPTGMARLVLGEVRLMPGEQLELGAPGGEWFVYVLSGQGHLQAAGRSEPLETGDFVGIPDASDCTLSNDVSAVLVCLYGGEKT